MKEYIIRCENNEFTLKGEIVHCKECRNRHRQKRCVGRHSDWFCADGVKQVTSKLNNPDDSLLTKNLEVCKEQKSKLDCISRQQAIEAVVNEWKGGFPQTNFLRTQGFHDWLKRILDNLPPVNKNNAEIATSDGEESTMGQPKIKLYIPLNKYTVDRVNQLLKNECGEYFDEEWLYNELEQIAERIQLSPETLTTSKTETVDTDLISRQAAIEAVEKQYFGGTVADINPSWRKLHNILESLPPVEPKRPKVEWVSCSETPKDRRNVFLAHGTNDFKSCCIGHYEQGMGWYEDRNFFAKPIYDCKYWCDIPELPDLGNKQFGTEVSADMRGDKE